jgi:hypothetical protein
LTQFSLISPRGGRGGLIPKNGIFGVNSGIRKKKKIGVFTLKCLKKYAYPKQYSDFGEFRHNNFKYPK